LIRVGAVLLIAWIIGAIYAKFFSRDQTRDLLLDQSRALSHTLLELIATQSDFFIAENSQQITLSESIVRPLIYIWRDQQLIVRQGAFDLPKPSQSETYVAELEGTKWVLSSSCSITNCVLVGFRDLDRRYVVRRIVAAIFVGLLVVLALAMLAMYFAIKSGLKPLENLTKELSDNDVSKLQAIKGHDHVNELKPLVDALNQLMENMRNQLQRERNFLDTCAHELRTPVAGLVAQIQSYSAGSSGDKSHQTIKLAADRTIRVANQFLSLAKNNNAQALTVNSTAFDLTELTRQVIADVLVDYQNAGCELSGAPSLQVKADGLALEIVIRNLLENPCRYGRATPDDQVRIFIDLTQRDSTCQLTVEDSGAGVPAAEFQELTQRFFRSQQAHDVLGAGLGLSIVEEVAQRYSGSVDISTSEQLGGLKVKVIFRDICATQTLPNNLRKVG